MKVIQRFIPGFDEKTRTFISKKDGGKTLPRLIDVQSVLTTSKALDKEYEDTKLTKRPAKPHKPEIREVSVQAPFKAIAKRLGVCGVDLQELMKSLATEDNELVDKAFRQFLMTAKLCGADALERSAASKAKVKDDNEDAQEYYINRTKGVDEFNATLDHSIQEAKVKAKEPWIQVLQDLKAHLEANNDMDRLHPSDAILIKAIRKTIGKGIVSIRVGKVTIDFDKIKMLKNDVGIQIMRESLQNLESFNRVETDSWVRDRKNLKTLKTILNDHSAEMDLNEYNMVHSWILEHEGRVILVCRDREVRDGGPWKPGMDRYQYAEHPRYDDHDYWGERHYPVIKRKMRDLVQLVEESYSSK